MDITKIKALSKLFALSGSAIEAIDEVQGTPFFNVKLQRKLKEAQGHFERIFKAFHSTNAQTEEETLESQTCFMLMQQYYDSAINALYNLDVDKLHLATSLLEDLQAGKIEVENE
jgi:hypothetical protein